jgi:hypothetical protein
MRWCAKRINFSKRREFDIRERLFENSRNVGLVRQELAAPHNALHTMGRNSKLGYRDAMTGRVFIV